MLARKINIQKSTTFLYRQKNAIIFKTIFIITVENINYLGAKIRHKLCKTVIGKKNPKYLLKGEKEAFI